LYDDDELAAVATFANGHVITLSTEPDKQRVPALRRGPHGSSS
jgi:hypothetical protein